MSREKQLDEFFDTVKLKLRELKVDLKNLQDYVWEGQEKVRSVLMTPENTHIIAHECTNKQIDMYFTMYPQVNYLKLVDKTIIVRKDWKNKTK